MVTGECEGYNGREDTAEGEKYMVESYRGGTMHLLLVQ